MQHDHQQQKAACRPDQLRIGLQEMTIPVNRLLSEEHLQVARQMPDYKQEEYTAADGHDIFLPQRGIENARNKVHSATKLTGHPLLRVVQ